MPITKKRYTAKQNQSSVECVLIHGWGASSVIWQDWLPVVCRQCNVTVIDLPGYGGSSLQDYTDIDALLVDCMDSLPQSAVYIGYSLGGMLALKLAERYPERVLAVITLASNAKFVAGANWTQAMAQETFATFYSEVKKNRQAALKRFLGLQSCGAQREVSLLKTLRSLVAGDAPCEETLIQSLQCLSALDNRQLLSSINVPVLQIFAQNDHLVPVSVAKTVADNDSVSTAVINGAPHCLFVSDGEPAWKIIQDFLLSETIIADKVARNLDKKQVARSFSKAAATYDSVADLQRRVGRQLQSYLPKVSAQVVLDLGCGTGFFSEYLQQHYPDSHLIGLDLAEGMVNFARDHHRLYGADWLCGDAENIPLANDSVDVIFSSLAIQWCEDIDALFTEINRVLKPAGVFVVSTLGPRTLFELREAWQAVDNYVHVNQFLPQDVLIDSAARAGLFGSMGRRANGAVFFDEQTITLEYSTLKLLTKELKSLGAHNVNKGRSIGLTGKKGMRAFVQAYERMRNEHNLLPASYQVWFGSWRKQMGVCDHKLAG